ILDGVPASTDGQRVVELQFAPLNLDFDSDDPFDVALQIALAEEAAKADGDTGWRQQEPIAIATDVSAPVGSGGSDISLPVEDEFNQPMAGGDEIPVPPANASPAASNGAALPSGGGSVSTPNSNIVVTDPVANTTVDASAQGNPPFTNNGYTGNA